VANEILSDIAGITIIGLLGDGIEIETDRYRAFSVILERLSAAGADIREIAGNDQVLLTALSDLQKIDGALYSVRRQGYGDYRHLIVVPVRDLADRLRALNGLRLEHVHDCLLAVLPIILFAWIAVTATVKRLSDAALAGLTIQNASAMTAKLYAAGAWLVLPAGLTGGLPLTRVQKAALS
jgi:hypothetical protein